MAFLDTVLERLSGVKAATATHDQGAAPPKPVVLCEPMRAAL